MASDGWYFLLGWASWMGPSHVPHCVCGYQNLLRQQELETQECPRALDSAKYAPPLRDFANKVGSRFCRVPVTVDERITAEPRLAPSFVMR